MLHYKDPGDMVEERDSDLGEGHGFLLVLLASALASTAAGPVLVAAVVRDTKSGVLLDKVATHRCCWLLGCCDSG